VKRRRRRSRRAPAPARSQPSARRLTALETRLSPLVREIAGIATSGERPIVRLERMLDALFAAYGEAAGLAGVLLDAWARAGRDKQHGLTLAWHQEQIRLAVVDVLRDGQRAGAVGQQLDAEATAAVVVGWAEARVLHAGSQAGAVGPREQARALLALITSGA
jgi:hypothetical protein